MAKNGLKCAKCGRSFALPMHLGRHMVTMHGAKPAKAKAPGKGRARARRGRRAPVVRAAAPVAAAWNGAPTTDQMTRDIQATRNGLAQQQARVSAQIAALDQFLATLGVGSPAAARRTAGRARRRGGAAGGGGGAREGSLKAYISQVLTAARRPMRVAEIATAVLDAGFETRNKTLAKSVGNMLVDMRNVRKVDRGIFSVK
ncbi:hypothetical protein RAS1_32960 [Phycisphaerae bacterium RAS1]|nr:hypothetical protein RAS1_32960 [Phycisphaerae bacterium RAS1]